MSRRLDLSGKDESLRTPAFIVDMEQVKRNCDSVRSMVEKAGLKLRCHMKTHKQVKIGDVQVAGARDAPICVSTLSEAWYFLENGYTNITYAVPLSPDKISEIYAKVAQRPDVTFNIFLDSLFIIKAIESSVFATEPPKCTFQAFLKIDTGYGRAGVNPLTEKENVLAVATALDKSPVVKFLGLYSHAGHSYNLHGRTALSDHAREERRVISEAARDLRAAGLTFDIVSVGSTPATIGGDCGEVDSEGHDLVNEVHAGNYVFYDRQQLDMGYLVPGSCAVYVASRVLGHYPARNEILIDAGALAMSKDGGAKASPSDAGYGEIREDRDLRLYKVSQEVGIVKSNRRIDFEKYPIGSILTITPNHSCLTAAMFPKYYLVENNEIVDIVTPNRGW